MLPGDYIFPQKKQTPLKVIKQRSIYQSWLEKLIHIWTKSKEQRPNSNPNRRISRQSVSKHKAINNYGTELVPVNQETNQERREGKQQKLTKVRYLCANKDKDGTVRLAKVGR